MIRHLPIRLLLPALGTLALTLFPASAPAAEAAASEGAPVPSTTTAASPPTGPSSSPSTTTPASTTPTSTSPAAGTPPTTTETSTTTQATAPQVKTQTPQAAGGLSGGHAHAKAHLTPQGGSGKGTPGTSATHVLHAPSPSALTPPLPFALGSPLSGVPDFFIANFPIPPFLLPIYQAAGRAYGIPWQVLAAINEVETDYGRDLSISSAGAEGWMQFLPSSWAQYGVDANGDGFADPYNPADAIFAAARYLRAAGGARQIRAAIFAYNHSQSYVASVLLRAQLLRGTPPQLLGAIANLAEARFPVHAPSHFSDGFPTAPGHATGRRSAGTLVATVIESRPGAPVIAVQDGVIRGIGRSLALGRYVSLRDAYGDTYTYGHLGSVATLYPVLTPHTPTRRRGHLGEAGVSLKSRHGGLLPPASAGVQPRSPMSATAVSSGLALGAAAALETTPAPPTPTPLLRSRAHPVRAPLGTPRVFRAGHEDVSLHPLQVGSQIIAGTVIGHLGAATENTTASQASMVFQIRPSGVGAPMIDPKPILDGWVRLEGSLIYRATGKHRFPAAPFTVPGSKLPHRGAARLANVLTPTLAPGQWLQLMARLGSIPDPVVAGGHSAAAIPTAGGKGNGNH